MSRFSVVSWPMALLVASCGGGSNDYTADTLANAERYRSLSNARSLVCDWQGGVALKGVEGDWQSSKIGGMAQIIFADLDLEAGDAEMVGNAGSSRVSASRASNAVTLVERTLSGNVNVITIFAGGNRLNSEDGYYATMSRHVSLEGEPLPSMYYGVCQARN